MEAAIASLQCELGRIKEGLAKVRSSVAPAVTVCGDSDVKQADVAAARMLKEVAVAMRQQAEGIGMMEKTVKSFPNRWHKLEISTDKRKTLLLDIKARRARDAT